MITKGNNKSHAILGVCVMLIVLGLVGLNKTANGQSSSNYYTSHLQDEGVQNVESLKSILEKVEESHNITFFYDDRLVDNKYVAVPEMKSDSLAHFLGEVLSQKGLTYQKQTDRTYVIMAKPAPSTGEVVQQESISGTVTDAESGETLPGVNILVKGTATGASTDQDGNFELEVPSLQDTLVVTYIGYQRQEVPINGRTELDIQLTPQAIMGEEMVVVGYGTQQEKSVTGSISSVSAEDLAERQTVQVSNALQGTTPGLTVTRNSGTPGGGSNFRIRGVTTIGNNSPLIILDGVPANSIDHLSPDDIEDISVLKDASAASIYGSRAAAGVILVTTKRGNRGEVSFNYGYDFGIQTPTKSPEYVNAVRYMELFNEFTINDGGSAVYSDDLINNYWEYHEENPDEYPATDWQEVVLRDYAPRHNHSLSFTVGNENIRSRASIGYATTQALFDNDSYDKYTIQVNNDFDINEWLSGRVDGFYKRTETKGVNVNAVRESRFMPGIYDDRYEDGRFAPGKEGRNPLAEIYEGGFNNSDYNRIGGNFSLEVNPIQNVSLEGKFAPVFSFNNSKKFDKVIEFSDVNDPSQIVYTNQGNTTLNRSKPEIFKYNAQFLLRYSKELFKNHTVGLLAGYEENYNKRNNLNASRRDFILTEFPYLNLGSLEFINNGENAYENALRSYFGRLQYNYQEKYFIEGSVRRDGSSRFASDNRWGIFPSFSAGWAISEEQFIQNINAISFLKIRGSWGELGNERIGNYPYQSSLTISDVLFYEGNQIVSTNGAAQRQLAVEDITWETTRTTNFGLDMRLFNNKLSFTADYFRKKTEDILLTLDVPDFIGFGDPSQNAGIVESKGWEAQIKFNDQAGDFSYSVGFNISDAITEIVDLKGTRLTGNQAKIEGGEFNEWFGFKTDGLFQTQEEINDSPTLNNNVQPGDIKYVDVNGDGEITPEGDRTLLGGSLPRYNFGSNIRLGYKNINLSMVFQGVGKKKSRLNNIQVQPFIANVGNVPKHIDGDYWSINNTEEQNLDVRYPRLSRQSASYNSRMSDYWLIDGSYLRVKNITLRYNLPHTFLSKRNIKDLSIYLSANDVFSFDHFPQGWDPEVNHNTHPIVTTFIGGVNIKF